MFPCFRVLIILYMNPWKSQVAQATLIHVCMENILHPKKCSLPDTLRRQSSAAAGTICTARAVWYRAQTGAARKASGRAWSALHLARPALLPVICGLSRCAGGWGLHRRGIQGAPGVGWVMPAIKFSKEKGVFRGSCCQHPPHLHKTKPIRLCKSPNFPKNTKRPISEPRLCYNQLKAIRQRKEESK